MKVESRILIQVASLFTLQSHFTKCAPRYISDLGLHIVAWIWSEKRQILCLFVCFSGSHWACSPCKRGRRKLQPDLNPNPKIRVLCCDIDLLWLSCRPERRLCLFCLVEWSYKLPRIEPWGPTSFRHFTVVRLAEQLTVRMETMLTAAADFVWHPNFACQG